VPSAAVERGEGIHQHEKKSLTLIPDFLHGSWFRDCFFGFLPRSRGIPPAGGYNRSIRLGRGSISSDADFRA